MPSAPTGLTAAEAAERLERVGPNELTRTPPPSPWAILAGQFANPLVLLLAGAAVVTVLVGEHVDAIAIGAIVVLNAIVGFVQEYRAERALLALRDMTSPRARVLRDGHVHTVAATEVVPGDLLLLEAGDLVAADAELVEAHHLRTIEAVLTGESLPVDKSTEPVPDDAPLAEQRHRVFAGTAVSGGSGTARVVATGMKTEMGRIADLLGTAESGPTPLQQQLARLGRTLSLASLVVVGLIGALELWRGVAWLDVLTTSVSLAVAAVPEGLPAVVTIALALGVQRMAGRNVLVRRLPAVETLGAVTVVCTDKTGTLTTGRMAVRDVWGADRDRLLDAAAACCDADRDTGEGDPTELAILEAAAERGIHRRDIERERPRVEVHPFDPGRKRMSIRRADGWLYVKGAVEAVAPACEGSTRAVEREAELMAERGLRVIAVARGRGAEEGPLECLGLLGLADPPRPGVERAVEMARRAGIQPVMITGDHPVTARAIARELGILAAGDDPDLVVHARVTPERKLAIVRDWKRREAVVAMTGDGANDAPSIREAHVGIAMGVAGTEVTREAADIVLTDDDFSSIVEGVREGRTIADNIRKALVYLLSGNAGEVLLMLAAVAVGLPVPLLPLHLLWINLVTDGLPALALVSDPPQPDVMRRPPRRPGAPVLGRAAWTLVGATAVLEGGVVFAAYATELQLAGVREARSFAFATLVVSQLLRSFAARSPTRVFWEVGVFTNLWLLGVVTFSVGLQVALFALPFTRGLFDLAPLGFGGVTLALALGFVPVSVLEIGKLLRRLLRRSSA